MLGTGSIQVANIVTFIALARWLPLQDFGTWRQLFLLHQVLFALFFSALPMSLLYFCGHTEIETQRILIRRHLYIVLIMGLATSLGLLVLAEPLARLLGKTNLTPLIRLFSPYPAAFMLFSLVAPTMVVLKKTRQSTLISVFLAIMGSVPVLVAAYFNVPIGTLVNISVLSVSVGAALATLIIIKNSRPIQNQDIAASLPSSREIFKYLWPLLLASGISLIGLRMDHLIVSHHFGQSVYAIYAVAAFEIPLFGMLQSNISSVLLPKFSKLAAERKWEEVGILWRRALSQSAIIVFPVAATLIVLAEPFVRIVFGEKFLDAVPIFQVFLLLAPIRIMTFGLVLRASGQTKPDLIGSVGYLLSISIFSMVGIKLFGPIGATLAVVCSTVSLAIWLALQTHRFTEGGVSITKMYPPYLCLFFVITVLIVYLVMHIGFQLAFNSSSTLLLVLGGTFSCILISLGLLGYRNIYNK